MVGEGKDDSPLVVVVVVVWCGVGRMQ